jgi:hypothetical protein
MPVRSNVAPGGMDVLNSIKSTLLGVIVPEEENAKLNVAD